MSAGTVTIIQTVAAVVQAIAAIVFFFSVGWEARERRREQRRRVIDSLRQLWIQSCVGPRGVAMTDEELAGFHSQRQIDFFNEQLKARGMSPYRA